MKIVVKTLQGKQTDYVVEDDSTVGMLKQKIAQSAGLDVSTIKLVHQGTLLNEDGKQLTAYGIKEQDFLVLMTNKVLSASHL